MWNRREFLAGSCATLISGVPPLSAGTRLVLAARQQIGTTTSYDPTYRHLSYPNGDVARTTGICADVIVRACRDALQRDLQQLVHEDMSAHFAAYPSTWGAHHPDSSIDHRRVLNLQTFWTRQGAAQWTAKNRAAAGDAFGDSLQSGDFVTWLINGSLPHVGILAVAQNGTTTVIHNIGNGAEETPLAAFHPHPAVGRYRWPNKAA